MLEEVYDFIKQFIDIDPENILQGYTQAQTLPKEQDFCILSFGDFERPGSNVQTWTDTETTLNRLINYSVLVDFIGLDNETQRKRASVVETIARSLEGAAFFKVYNIALNYGDGFQYLPYIYEDRSYSHRYRVTLHFSKWEAVTLAEQTAASVKPGDIVNVDAKYKP